MLLKLKYSLILTYAAFRRKSVVDLFGGTYVVSGNYVRRIR
jgi:hypothetical protein